MANSEAQFPVIPWLPHNLASSAKHSCIRMVQTATAQKTAVLLGTRRILNSCVPVVHSVWQTPAWPQPMCSPVAAQQATNRLQLALFDAGGTHLAMLLRLQHGHRVHGLVLWAAE